MSTDPPPSTPADVGLSAAEAAALGSDGAARVRAFRLIVLLAIELRTLMDRLLDEDGLTTQQAALLSVVSALGEPSLGLTAAQLGTTHQNARQIAAALERKGHLVLTPDAADRRVLRLAATPQSRAVWARRSARDQREVVRWFGALAEAEAAELLRLLRVLEGGVREALGDG